MFPWNIEDLGRIVVGRPLLPIYQELFLDKCGRKPSRATLEKLRACDTSIRPSTLKKLGIGFALNFIKNPAIQGLQPTPRQYAQFFDLISEVLGSLPKHPQVEESKLFHMSLREILPQTLNSMLWVEQFWIDFCEQGGGMKLNNPDGPSASIPLGIMKNAPVSWSDEEKRFRIGLLLEHHFFMLYSAAFEEDLSHLSPEFEIPTPSLFVPVELDDGVHYPMWSFWRWFRDRADCETWGELAEKADFNNSDSPDNTEGDQVVRNWANAKPKPSELNAGDCKMISWNRLRQALKQIEGPDSNPFTPFQMEIQCGYGIARILQEHAARCLPTVLDFCSSDFPLKSFYQDRIELCRKNECRRIPALIAKL